jgi:hypothetical protein
VAVTVIAALLALTLYVFEGKNRTSYCPAVVGATRCTVPAVTPEGGIEPRASSVESHFHEIRLLGSLGEPTA